MKKYKLDITITSLGLPMHGGTIATGEPLGGSETAAIQQSFALAKLGHRVTLFCNTEKQHTQDGVIFMPFGWVSAAGNPEAKFPKGFFDFARSTPCDVMIIQRQPALFQFEFPSKVNILWQHDLATKTGPSQFGPVIWSLDKIFVLSEFMKQQYKSVHGGPDDLYHVTRNGIDLSLIDSVPNQERDRFKMMFTARPERGLDILLTQVWPEVLKREPRAKLYLSRYQDNATLQLYEDLKQLAKQFGDSVVDLGHLGKQELYRHYKQARLFLYSSVFEETSNITSQELGGCGAVMIGPWKGACPETCAGAHVLIKDDGNIGLKGDAIDPGLKPPTPQFIRSFIDQTIDLIHDDNRWQQLSTAARRRAEQWQWGPVAEEWTELFHELIAKRSNDPKRMIKHLLVKSDVVGADKYADQHPEDPTLRPAVNKYIDRFLPFMKVTDPSLRRQALADFYEQRSGGNHADYRVAFWADTEPRCRVLIDWLSQRQDEIKSYLDFGCAHGGYVRAVSNALPLSALGVDVSPALIRCCEELKRAPLPDGKPAIEHPENVSFAIGDENGDWRRLNIDSLPSERPYDGPKQFDCVTCLDTLEHLPDAEEVAEKLEKFAKPNGWVVLTVPTGNRERSEFVMKNIPPVHVRAFDQHDLIDIFGKKKDFHIMAFSDLVEAELDRTFSGWYLVAYRADGQKLGRIDWERHFFLQGPRETLAVCMIANNEEHVLHRCLRSVQRIADQIIVLDNGPSTDRTVQVASEYTNDVRAGTSPFFCYTHLMDHPQEHIQPGTCDMAGFETPRNESIEDAWADWILWIDGDEQLLQWESLWKYLRPSPALMGYAMQQHHVAVDPPGIIKRDIPVRLFRNHCGVRFYGCVTPDTLVTKNPDVVPITDIKVGDYVRTHDGTYGRVSKLWEYDTEDTLVELLAVGMPTPLRITRDHKLYAIRGEKCHYEYKTRPNGVICKPICSKTPECPHRFFEHYAPEWIMAKDIKPGDLLMYPIDNSIVDHEHSHLSDHAISHNGTGSGSTNAWKLINGEWESHIHGRLANQISDKIDVTGGLLRLIGYYISDGHAASNGRLVVSFGSHETEYVNDLMRILSEIGLKPRVQPDKILKMTNVVVSCKPLCEWLIGEFGTGSHDKKAPLWVMRLPFEKQTEFLRGLWRGDGNVSGSLVRYSTVCRTLASQVQDLLLRQGICANIRWGKASKTFEVFARVKRRKFLDWTMPDTGPKVPSQVWSDGRYVYMRVKSKKLFPYKGKVNDITVEGNHSFVFGRVAGENCVHEHAETGINKGVGQACLLIPDVHIHHDGYLTEPIRRKRFWRNFKLLQCDRLKYPERILGKFLYDIRDNMHLAKYEMERNGGQLTPYVREHLTAVTRAFRENFLSTEYAFLAEDALGYYSEALMFLGEGLEVAVNLDVRPNGAQLNGMQKFRVGNQAEAEKLINRMLGEKFRPFEGPYSQ